jgi:Zn-dependent peptidase ImmA (M78 family)
MKKADRAALRTLESHDALSAPVDVEALARALGAEVRRQPFDGNVSGMLLRDGRRVLIGLNKSHSERRQRFSIAHELGHLVLHRGKPLFVDHTVRVNLRDNRSATGTEEEEIEANAFAAQLLMPEPLVRSEVEKARDRMGGPLTDEQLMDALAAQFNVSPQAMGFRLINLGIIDPAGA